MLFVALGHAGASFAPICSTKSKHNKLVKISQNYLVIFNENREHPTLQKSPECTLEDFSKVPELVSILTCDLEKSKQANLAKKPLGGTAWGGRGII